MRNAIRDRIIEEVEDFGARVYEPYMPDANTEKPYAVIVMGGEAETNMRYGFDVPVRVWVYVDKTSFSDVDSLLAKVINALNGVELEADDLKFGLRYTGSTDDTYDETWKALTRQANFVTETIRGG